MCLLTGSFILLRYCAIGVSRTSSTRAAPSRGLMLSGVVGTVESSQELSLAVVDGDVERNSMLLAKPYESIRTRLVFCAISVVSGARLWPGFDPRAD